MEQDKQKKEDLMGIFEHPLRLMNAEEVLTREVKEFGGGASGHIIIPKKHVGRDTIITIKSTQNLKTRRLGEEELKKKKEEEEKKE